MAQALFLGRDRPDRKCAYNLRMLRSSLRLRVTVCSLALAATACGTSADNQADPAPTDSLVVIDPDRDTDIRLVSPLEGSAIQTAESDDVIILDVRTPDEFGEGHLEGAIMIDFYDDDFAEQLAALDPDASYLIYCRSGNRSGQTVPMLVALGFTDVADVDGGIVAWTDAGLPTVIE